VSGFIDEYSHAQTITENFVFLTRNIDVTNSLLAELYQHRVLNDDEMESLSCMENRRSEQTEHLLFILVRKTKEQYNRFLDALDTTRQSYIREHISSNQQSHCTLDDQ